MDLADPHEDLAPLFDLIVAHVPRAGGRGARRTSRPQLLAVLIETDPFLGRLLTGRVDVGQLDARHGDPRAGAATARRSSAAGSPSCWPSAA